MKNTKHVLFSLFTSSLLFCNSLFAQTDGTGLLTNPGFETGDYTGWTWTGRTGGWETVNNDGDKTKEGTFIAGYWNNPIGDVECSQTLNGLNNGFYKVTALVTVSKERLSNHRLFANSNSTLYGQAGHPAYTAENLAILANTEHYKFAGLAESAAENGPFRKISVVTEVTDGTLVLGFRFSGNASAAGYLFPYSTRGDIGFFKFDNFTLTEVSEVVTLDSLRLSAGTLDRPFAPDVYNYTATLPAGTKSVTPFYATTVDGESVMGDEPVDVSSGSGVSSLEVTSPDGKTYQNYTITYKVLSLSNDVSLKSLETLAGTLTPAFNALDSVYYVEVPLGSTSAYLTALPNDVKTKIAGDGTINLVNGKGTAEITATAENGNQKTYTIYIDQAYILNPGFETGDFTGWNWTGGDSYVWRGVNTDGDDTKTGQYIAGIWNSTFEDIELSQTIVGLTNGLYTVTADLMGSSNNTTSRLTTQRLFANNCSMLFGRESDYSAENLALLQNTEKITFGGYQETQNDQGPFQRLSVTSEVKDGTMTLGIRTNGTLSNQGFSFPNLSAGDGWGWFKVDHFTMTYAGPANRLNKQVPDPVSWQVQNRILSIKNASLIRIYNASGQLCGEWNSKGDFYKMLSPGMYLIKTEKTAFKVLIR